MFCRQKRIKIPFVVLHTPNDKIYTQNMVGFKIINRYAKVA